MDTVVASIEAEVVFLESFVVPPDIVVVLSDEAVVVDVPTSVDTRFSSILTVVVSVTGVTVTTSILVV